MEGETATKLVIGTLAIASTLQGVYHVHRFTTGVGEDLGVGVGFLLLGFVGWVLLVVRAERFPIG